MGRPRKTNRPRKRTREEIFAAGGWQPAMCPVPDVQAFYEAVRAAYPDEMPPDTSFSGVVRRALIAAANVFSPAGRRVRLESMAMAVQGALDTLARAGHLAHGFKAAANYEANDVALIFDEKAAKAYAAGTIDATQLMPGTEALA